MEYYCNVCKQGISQEVYAYSQKYFRTPLCRDHQKMEREKEASSKANLGTKSLDEVIYNSRVLDNSNSSSMQNELKLEILLKDARAIRIAKGVPIENRNEVIEKYIILGEMVASHASISTDKETVAEFFSPLKNDIDMIREQLRMIVPAMATPGSKGKITVDVVFESLKEHFMDDSFEDVSKIGKFADILATTADSGIPILIELKDYSKTVPIDEVEKFWRDIERRGTKYGIFISMRTGIAKCSSCISVKTEMNKTAVFINNSELNWSGHLFAYYVIKKIAELESAKKKELNGQEIGQVIAKVNKHILGLQRDVESIDKIEDVADSLRSTCKKKLDELISVSNVLKRNMNEGIDAVIADLEAVENIR
jgi:hypothetical protein